MTDASNPTGLVGVCVTVLTPGGASVGTATTTGDGTYEVDLSSGTYVVEFDPTCGGSVSSPDVGQYSGGVYSLGSAAQIIVDTVDEETANATLAASGSVSGTVTDAANPSGLAGVCVTATDASDTIGASGTATTAPGGTYTISGLAPGSFQVFFDPTCNGSMPSPDFTQWYSNSSTEGGATPVTVSSGNTTTSINAALESDGSISGTVTDAANPGGFAGVCVIANSATGGSGTGTATSAGNGTYSISGLPPDSYTVEFDPSCQGTVSTTAIVQWYSGATKEVNATPVVVASGTATTNINASLSVDGSISGTITDAFHPGGLNDVCVAAVSSDGGSGSGSTATGANGTYTVTGLAPDTYTVNFDPTCSGHNSTHDVAKSYGSAVTVTSGANTPNISAVLATIAGTSTNTAVTSSANPGTASTPVTYTATVAPTDNGGTVAFSDDGQPITACTAQTVTASVATCTVTYPGIGSHEISAVYSGDENYGTSTSTNYDEVIQTYIPPPTPSNPAKTTTDLTSNANPATLGYVTYSATVYPTNNQGTVSFFDALQPIAGCQNVSLTSGVAQCLVITPSFGIHSITASFSGSPAYDPSKSSVLSEEVQIVTTTSVASSYNPAGDEAGITFTATTSPFPDGGTMQFQKNGVTIAACASNLLTDGASTCTLKNMRPGNHVITALYSGDASYESSTSETFTEKILRNSAITVSSSNGVARKGATIHFVAKVAKKFGTGFVAFTDNGEVMGPCKRVRLRSGVAVCSIKSLSVGHHIVSVAFSGNSSFGPSYSGLLEVIKK
ncbi:MAG: Ig-like domain repeat protein [Acidimicrobiales bacterium]